MLIEFSSGGENSALLYRAVARIKHLQLKLNIQGFIWCMARIIVYVNQCSSERSKNFPGFPCQTWFSASAGTKAVCGFTIWRKFINENRY